MIGAVSPGVEHQTEWNHPFLMFVLTVSGTKFS